jgi:hypothetical protein
VWIAHSEYRISKKQLPGKFTQYGIADMKVVSQRNGKCSSLDTFTVYAILRDPIFYRYYLDIGIRGSVVIRWRYDNN